MTPSAGQAFLAIVAADSRRARGAQLDPFRPRTWWAYFRKGRRMRTFHAGGKDWSVGIGARRLREIQAVTGRTLASADGGLLLAIYTDPLIAYEALAVLLKEQAADRGVSEDALSDMLVGDVLGRARRVLADELIDFEPLADRREAMRAMLGRLDKLETAMVDRIRAGVENIDPEALADELLKGGNDGP